MSSLRQKIFESSMSALLESLTEDNIPFRHDRRTQEAVGSEFLCYSAELPSGERLELEAAKVEDVRNRLTVLDGDDERVVDMVLDEGRLQAEFGGMRLADSPFTTNAELISLVERMVADAVAANGRAFLFDTTRPANTPAR